MPENSIAVHYTQGGLLNAIREGVRAIGKSPDTVTVDELAPVDEFHIGGRQASEDFLSQLNLTDNDHVLDVGCGFGGTARFVTSRYGCQVTGIDLTSEFVETGCTLCEWVGLSDRIELHQGSALDLPYDPSTYDAAYMLHVGMNIADKFRLFRQILRVIKPNALFGIYDIVQTSGEQIAYPVPWATNAAQSSLGTEQEYREGLARAGFDVIALRDRAEFAAKFFEAVRQRVEASGLPALGIHIAMGNDAPLKISNMVENIAAGRVSPIEIIARKA